MVLHIIKSNVDFVFKTFSYDPRHFQRLRKRQKDLRKKVIGQRDGENSSSMKQQQLSETSVGNISEQGSCSERFEEKNVRWQTALKDAEKVKYKKL